MPHFKLGQIYYFAKKDIKEAREEFKKVLQINPRHSEAQKFLNLIVQGNQSINP
ncbi:MAG: tetratricopeptide repeat protein [Nitrospirae bacterium]|nr:tetratricopeptide repeat protein [Nitrospirota bacterium]